RSCGVRAATGAGIGFIEQHIRYTVLQRAAASPFNDEENEFRSSITLDIPHVISHTVGKMMDHKNAAAERQRAKEPKPWISPQECNMLTATEGVAVEVP
ncbi:hypothetical protein, partial [Salmonella enterica]|uniref:hypothetical protein n=1 Tax=Salmonella enterica TaxID=28901 RepID=UPI000AF21414